MSKNKAFCNISSSKLSRNRVFPWNLFVYSWQGEKHINYPIYISISLYIYRLWRYRKRHDPKTSGKPSIWKCCSMLRNFLEICISIPFSTLRGISVQGGGQGTPLPHWPPVHVSAWDSTFPTKPLGCTSVLQREQMEPRTPAQAEAQVVHCWARPVLRYLSLSKCEVGKITLNFTQHKRKWSSKQIWSVLN